jgi:enterochelin esterase-like enzyme
VKKSFLIFAFISISLLVSAQTFEDFINYLNSVQTGSRQEVVDSFLVANQYYPLTEDTLAHFIFIGPGEDLEVAGDFNGWNPPNGSMTSIIGTNFWYRTYTFENDARLDYKFVYNGGTWILDPKNPNTCPGGFGDNSELRMSAYIPPPEINYYADIPHGTLEDTIFYSTNLSNTRTIKVYLPPGYSQSTENYPMILVHDGLEYISFAKMNNILDYMIFKEKIVPTIALFIPPVERTPEYEAAKQDAFTDFIVEEVMPWINTKYRTINEPAANAVIGSSLGGNISLWLGMNHPDVFGHVGAFSPFIENDILTTFSTSPMLDLQIYMIHGKYDHLDPIQQSVDAFLPILEEKEYDYEYGEYPEGHSYGFWRAYVDDALEFFFPGPQAAIFEYASIKTEGTLMQNYPNPFNQQTQIDYELKKPSRVILEVYNFAGQLVKLLKNEQQGQGKHAVTWNGTDNSGNKLPIGIYFSCLFIDNNMVGSRKMVLIP